MQNCVLWNKNNSNASYIQQHTPTNMLIISTVHFRAGQVFENANIQNCLSTTITVVTLGILNHATCFRRETSHSALAAVMPKYSDFFLPIPIKYLIDSLMKLLSKLYGITPTG
jgi:hypothetical protein